MRVAVAMPRMGQSMEEGRIARWLKPQGATVKRGDPLVEIETDKATVELEAKTDGILAAIVVAEEEIALVGAPIAYIETAVNAPTPKPPTSDPHMPDPHMPDPHTPATSERSPSQLPRQQSPTTPPIASDFRERRAPDLQPTHANRPERIPASPLARRLAAEHGITLSQLTGTGPDGRIGRHDVERFLAAQPSPSTSAAQPRRAQASPLAKRMAAEHGVDLTQVAGTGPDGRIGKEDILAWLSAHAAPPSPPAAPTQAEPIPSIAPAAPVHRIPLTKMRQTAPRRMVESKTTAPHFYVSMDIDMGRALALRDSFKQRNLALTINDILLKAAALALVHHPTLNASLVGNEIHTYAAVDLALAVALDEGLITPVIHGCEALSLTALAQAAQAVIERARNGRLQVHDLEGGTFTVTNLGMFGVRHFEAILNPPQAAILALGALRREPVFDAHDRVVPAQLLTATLSVDHRVVDGAEAARFLRTYKEVIEDAFVLLA